MRTLYLHLPSGILDPGGASHTPVPALVELRVADERDVPELHARFNRLQVCVLPRLRGVRVDPGYPAHGVDLARVLADLREERLPIVPLIVLCQEHIRVIGHNYSRLSWEVRCQYPRGALCIAPRPPARRDARCNPV